MNNLVVNLKNVYKYSLPSNNSSFIKYFINNNDEYKFI